MKFLIILISASLASCATIQQVTENVDQNKINQKVDQFLQKYKTNIDCTNGVHLNGLVTIPVVQRPTIGGDQYINGTKVHGLENLQRIGTVNATQNSKYQWTVNGTLMVPVVKLAGAVQFYNATKRIPEEEVKFVSFSSEDLIFYFQAHLDFKWNELKVEEFYYNGTSYQEIEFFTSLTGCPVRLFPDCAFVTEHVQRLLATNFVGKIKDALQELITSTPFTSN